MTFISLNSSHREWELVGFTGTFGSQFVVAETARCGGGVAGTFQVSGYRPDAESAVFIDKKNNNNNKGEDT